jgi:hypothetical protein
MNAEQEISADMTTDERAAMLEQPLSPPARVALETAAPHPGGVPAWWFTCSVGVARELLERAETGATRLAFTDSVMSALFGSAAKQMRFALTKARKSTE